MRKGVKGLANIYFLYSFFLFLKKLKLFFIYILKYTFPFLTHRRMFPIVVFVIFLFLLKMFTILIISLSKQKKRYRDDFYEDYEIGFVSMNDAVKYVLKKNMIQSRQDLDEWCGGQCRERFYKEVRNVARITWHMEDDSKKRIRAIYESLLPGYTNARVN